ncbi:RNA-guided pseudouridylation complex pseudouridine synthase subunit Cbf5 [Candidatus Woesearchaeota archaeon]|nr:RNA-guided pseudouridylation complex pseudouridine synthase subunit Cbf5 [Candidatus Woesearchaeota archaeon]
MKLPSHQEFRIIVRKKAVGKLGVKPEDRDTETFIKNAIVNIDKPAGPTSHNVSAYVQRILRLKKAGHSGTLDPAVTGVLPVALENAVKVAQALMGSDKEYVCVMYLHKTVEEVGLKKLKEAFDHFTGKIMQMVPKKSAVKRQEREREIHYIKLLETKDKDVLFIVGCQAGTYIRKLCHDIGEYLGCGAHMKELRRTKAGPFDESTLVTLNKLKDVYDEYKETGNDRHLRKLLLPVEYATRYIPKIWCDDEAIKHIKHGRSLLGKHISKLTDKIEAGQLVCIMSLKGELIALGISTDSSTGLKTREGVAARIKRVF